jgi:uncharacterized delta-60 repeat protein
MFLSWLSPRTQRSASRRKGYRTKAGRACFKPRLELLETRTLLSGGGSLNPNFGSGGLVTTNFGGADFGSALTIQPDGKIVVVGTDFSLTSSTAELDLARYNTDGSLDQSFGSGGKVQTLIGASTFDFSPGTIASRPGGKIIVAATEVDPTTFNFNLVVVQYNHNGSLDQSFGSGGYVITSLSGGGFLSAAGLALSPPDHIVAVANAGSSMLLVEYNRDGSLDQNFGSGGMVTTSLLTGVPTFLDPFGIYTSPSAQAVTVDRQGRILVAGGAIQQSAGLNAMLVRYNPDGSLDQSFGIQGTVMDVFGIDGFLATAVAVRPTGKIVVGGRASTPVVTIPDVFAVEQFNTDGSPDPTFGFDGLEGTTISNENLDVTSLVFQSNGDLVVVGSTLTEGTFTNGFVMVRYNTDGSPDQTFGTGGIVTTFEANPSGPFAVALEANGDIVVAGSATDPNTGNEDFALAEYLPGTSSPIFRSGPAFLEPRGLQSGSGSLNPNFGTGGVVSSNFGGNDLATGIATQADGKIVAVANDYSADFSTSQLAVARYNTDGSLDQNFGSGGFVLTAIGASDFYGSAVIQRNGKIDVAAVEVDPTTLLWNILLVQYNSDGSLDQTFGTGGYVITSLANGQNFTLGSLSLAPGARLIVVGGSSGGSAPGGLILAEFNHDGSLDQSFGSGGIVTTTSFQDAAGNTFTSPSGNALAFDRSGRILVAGLAVTNPVTLNNAAVLARYNPDGSLDQSFGFQGAVTNVFDGPSSNVFVPTGTSATAVAVRPDGKIIVAGNATPPGGLVPLNANFAVERLNSDGSPDFSFGSDGIVLYGAPYGYFGTFNVTGLVLQSNGDIVLEGPGSLVFGGSTVFAMIRLTANGNFDQSFGSGGVVTATFPNAIGTPFYVAVEPNGDFVVVGSAFDPNTGKFDIGLAEYLP